MDITPTFTQTNLPNVIPKCNFTSLPPSTNLLKITYDTQNHNWNFGSRESIISNYLKTHRSFRNVTPITLPERVEKQQYLSSMQHDIFYQYHSFIPNINFHILHFQLRKNIKHLNNLLFYTKQSGIEAIDLTTLKQQLFYSFDTTTDYDGNFYAKIISFDIKQLPHNNEFVVALARVDERVQLVNFDYNEYKQSKTKAMNTRLNYKSNTFIGNIDLNEENLVNYVNFIPNNRLLTTGNDCTLKIYDIPSLCCDNFDIKNTTPINHCDYNENKNCIICVGDSKDIDIFDIRCKTKSLQLQENYDFGIAIKFNSYNDNYFANTNQDHSTKIWDIRNTSHSLYTNYGLIETSGDLVWLNDHMICYCENSLYLHIYDMLSHKEQTLMYVGSMSGIVYDEKKEMIYIGIDNKELSGLIRYNVIKDYKLINI